MKTCFALLIVLLVATHAEARIHRFWNYAELTTNATLVVVATPMKVALTSEIAALP